MNHKLSLKQHCIETTIKKDYNKSISGYFKSGKNPADHIQKRIEVFHQALETIDFENLRNRYPTLQGNSEADITLYKDPAEQLHITINGEDIEPKIQI